MHSRYLEGFVSGKSLKFGTLDEFAGVSNILDFHINALKAQYRQHLLEGTSIPGPLRLSLHMNGVNLDLVGAEGIDDTWEGQSANIVSFVDGNVTHEGNVTSLVLPNYAMFCASQTLDDEVVDRIKGDSARYSGVEYDVCVPILHVEKFAERLLSGLQRVHDNSRITKYAISDVQYTKSIEHVAQYVNPMVMSEFCKPVEFSSQKERRIVFYESLSRFERGPVIELEDHIEDLCGKEIYI